MKKLKFKKYQRCPYCKKMVLTGITNLVEHLKECDKAISNVSNIMGTTLTNKKLNDEMDKAIDETCGDDPYVAGYRDGLIIGAKIYK